MRRVAAVAGAALLFGASVACGSSSSSSAAPPADGGGGEAGALSPGGDPPVCATTPGTGGTPEPRGDVAGALDPTATKLVVFGGDEAVPACPISSAHDHAGDTWLLDPGCGAWRQAPGDGPPARARHAMATDATASRALLFGGRVRPGASGAYTLFNDVWSFDFAAETWQSVAASGAAPPARSNTAIVVDTAGNQLVAFGGNTDTTGLAYTPLDDTWVMDLSSGAWRALAPSTKPPARLFHAMAIDPASRVVYVMGGADANALTSPTFFRDVWALDLAKESWSQVDTAGDQQRGRINHGMTFDTQSKRLVVFGGHDDGPLGNENDLNVLDLTASPARWTRLAHGDAQNKPATGACAFPADFTTIDKASPERRSAFVFALRIDGRAFVIFAGKSDCGLVGDTWWWADGTEAWSVVKDSPVGLSCLSVKTTCTGLCG